MLAKKQRGFTLVELLIISSIIVLLASIVLVSVKIIQARSRDSRRLADMKQIILALETYYDSMGRYPSITGDACCNGWDQAPCETDITFISTLVNQGYVSAVPFDPGTGSGTGCYGYNYYVYTAGSYGCDASKGRFYVLGVRDMETSGRPHPDSPGWKCPNRHWQNEFDWVTGDFEY